MSTCRLAGLLTAVVLAAGISTVGPAAAAATGYQVLTLNTWIGGANVSDGINKIVTVIRNSGANIVALQEKSGDSMKTIAGKLGWNYTASGTDVDVLSPLPITRSDNTTLSGANIAGALINDVWFYSTHLAYDPYGPYLACAGKSYNEIYAGEAVRKQQSDAIGAWAATYRAQVLSGDFNSPSELDWTPATQAKHCDSVVTWPATADLAAKGWKDAYRTVHPDPAADPANTWSPVEVNDPQDRIDFTFGKNGDTSKVTTTFSRVIGGGADWPSDHNAVLSTLTIG